MKKLFAHYVKIPYDYMAAYGGFMYSGLEPLTVIAVTGRRGWMNFNCEPGPAYHPRYYEIQGSADFPMLKPGRKSPVGVINSYDEGWFLVLTYGEMPPVLTYEYGPSLGG